MDGLRDWLAGLTRRELALVGLLGVAALGGVALWYARTLPPAVRVRAAPVAEPTPSPSPPPLVVHVVGWVRNPGVYELSPGQRVIDAIRAAGGPRRDADLGALNLAAVLTDAQQVVVPRTGGGTASGPGAPSASTSSAETPLVNVNTAAPEDLETLPGIGEVLAAAILAYREEHGPFSSVDQLVEVSGIGEVTLEEIRELVTV